MPQPFSSRSLSEWIVQLEKSDSPDDRLQALQAVGATSEPAEAARYASMSLEDTDSTVRALAAKLSGSPTSPFSDETEHKLVSLLTDVDPDVRFEAARAVTRRKSSQSSKCVPVLFAFLDEPETHALMVAAVVNTLVEIDLSPETTTNEILPRLKPFLEHDRAEVREAIANAFAKWPSMSISCTELLVPLVDDTEPVVRERISYALGQAGVKSESVRTALRTACNDEDEEVARVAAEALRILES